MRVYIDPSCDILYSSYYIQGLKTIPGLKVSFSSRYFKQFRYNNQFFAFIIIYKGVRKKLIIDFGDDAAINHLAYDWADVYGKINLEINETRFPKAIAIGPSFGIKLYSGLKAKSFALINLIKAFGRIENKKNFLGKYKAQQKRWFLKDYTTRQTSNPGYVHFISTLWKKERETNQFRANFIRSLSANPAITFEGGFAPRIDGDTMGFQELIVNGRCTYSAYISRLQQSAFTFNTPAVLGCHGWKLAEFLCLGKAIISTPLTRQMPAPIEQGKHMLFTTGIADDLNEAINQMINNQPLRIQLESNAANYFSTNLAPEKVIQKLINKAFNSH